MLNFLLCIIGLHLYINIVEEKSNKFHGKKKNSLQFTRKHIFPFLKLENLFEIGK